MKGNRRSADKGLAGWPVSRMALRFGMVGGGVAWTLHLLLSYVVAEFGCLAGLGEVRFLGLTVVAWLLLGVTLAVLALGGMAAMVSWRSQRILEGHVTEGPDDLAGEKFMARTGFVTNVAFLAIIAVQAIPIFYFLRAC
jgi:hypothetical protein